MGVAVARGNGVRERMESGYSFREHIINVTSARVLLTYNCFESDEKWDK